MYTEIEDISSRVDTLLKKLENEVKIVFLSSHANIHY